MVVVVAVPLLLSSGGGPENVGGAHRADDLLGAGVAPVRSARFARSCAPRRSRVPAEVDVGAWTGHPLLARQDSRGARAPAVVLPEPAASARVRERRRASVRSGGAGSAWCLDSVTHGGCPGVQPTPLPDSGTRWFPGTPPPRRSGAGRPTSEGAQPRLNSRRCRPTEPVTRPVGCGGPAPATRWRRSRATQPRGLCYPTRAGRSRSLSGKRGPTGQLLRSPPPAIVRVFREARGLAMRRSGRLSRR